MKKVFIICSKYCYNDLNELSEKLKDRFEIVYPNCYEEPFTENKYRNNLKEHSIWKKEMFKESIKHISNIDFILVYNKTIQNKGINYIGGATLLEMYEGFRQNKPIYVFNDLPDCSYTDELIGLTTKVIKGDLNLLPLSDNILGDLRLLSFLDIEKDIIDVNKDLIEISRKLLNKFKIEPFIFPIKYNGIQFEWEKEINNKIKYIEMCVYANNLCTCLIMSDDTCVYQKENINLTEALKIVDKYLEEFYK